ncbi:MAG: hypothetical protein LBG69_01890 [Zoogloeaceae bacterium]|nr:hypothetical protein [Zoogloeaceae bacterium]
MAFSLEIGEIRHALFSLRGARVALGERGGNLFIEELEFSGRRFRKTSVTCGRLSVAAGNFRCEEGMLRLEKQPPIAFDLARRAEEWQLTLTPRADEVWRLFLQGDGAARLELVNANPALLFALLPSLAEGLAWKPSGLVTGQARYDKARFSADLAIQEGGYAAPDGHYAAEKLDMTLLLGGQKETPGGAWRVKGDLQWRGGQMYSAPLLLKGEGQRVEAAGVISDTGWRLENAALSLPRIGEITARGSGSFAALEDLSLQAPALMLRPFSDSVISPLLASLGKPRLQLEGELAFSAKWQGGELREAAIQPKKAGLTLEDGRVAFRDVSGEVSWQAQKESLGALSVGQFSLGRVEGGAFTLPFVIWPQKSFALRQPVTIPLLDGALVVRHLAAGLAEKAGQESEWEGALGLSITPISLETLTERLELPKMGGALSADLPLIRYERREAALDGSLVIRVFDGYLHCRKLRFIDPLGARPRILADLEARHLDLEQVTRTFSFGQITGFVDADLSALEISNWRPVAFEARVLSSSGSYPRRISQKAVDNVTSLSGGGAMAAMQSSVLRMFSDFGYRRMGLSCRLKNGVCHMRGIEGTDKNDAYTIVEGGGIPALTIMGYRREIDWEELIARLKAATQSSGPVVR